MARPCRFAAVFLAILLALPALSAAAQSQAPAASYNHVWEGQSAPGSSSLQKVDRDEIRLGFGRNRYQGTLHYEDRTGFRDARGSVTGQWASIDLTLTGAPVGVGADATGTFSGTARLLQRNLDGLEMLADPATDARTDGLVVGYRVSGVWGAAVKNGRAVGTLLFENVKPTSISAVGTPRPVEWFNRRTSGSSAGVGAAQTFSVPVARLDAPPGDAKEIPGRQPSFLDYVRRGLSDDRRSPATPVPAVLRAAGRRLFDARPVGATPLPKTAKAVDVDVAGAYLDAKNLAAGMVDPFGWRSDPGTALGDWHALRPERPGTDSGRSVPSSVNAVYFRTGLAGLLAEQTSTPGAEGLMSGLSASRSETASGGEIERLRAYHSAARALSSPAPYGSILSEVGAIEGRLIERPIPTIGAGADAVVVAADGPEAPVSSSELSAFTRVPAQDVVSAEGTSAMSAVLALAPAEASTGPPRVSWQTASGLDGVAVPRWLAYRRADGRVFWLAGANGRVAITDGSLIGAGFQRRRAYVVEPGRVGRVVGAIDIP